MTESALPNEIRAELERQLRAGLRADDFGSLAAQLGAAPNASEAELAAGLLRRAVALQLERLRLARKEHESERSDDNDSRVVDGRASFLMRLTRGGAEPFVDLERLDDLRTLMAVVRAGRVVQRRAAVLRISELLATPRRIPGEQAKPIIDALIRLPGPPIAYELWLLRSRLTGTEGRKARAEGDHFDELNKRIGERVRAFWDGEDAAEPFAALRDEQRIALLARTRDLPDEIARHLCAVIEGSAGDSARAERHVLLAGLIEAGDARLLPALRAVVDSGEGELLVLAARALGRIEDPRAHSALKAGYERTAAPDARLVLAGALGVTGDSRGLAYVREVIREGDERLLPAALEALAELGGRDDVQAVTELLARKDPAVVTAAVQTLGRVGDGRALLSLHELVRNVQSSALRAEIEEALLALRARMELLGEEAPPLEAAARSFDTAKRAAIVKRRDPALVRLRARFNQGLGRIWLALGAHGRGVARLEAAAALLPDAPAPVLSVAMAHARRRDNAQALASFRRVLEIDRNAVEANASAARMLALAFLRRAEAMEREGRPDIGRGLIEEALSLDLRRAPSDLRIALEQRLIALNSRAA